MDRFLMFGKLTIGLSEAESTLERYGKMEFQPVVNSLFHLQFTLSIKFHKTSKIFWDCLLDSLILFLGKEQSPSFTHPTLIKKWQRIFGQILWTIN